MSRIPLKVVKRRLRIVHFWDYILCERKTIFVVWRPGQLLRIRVKIALLYIFYGFLVYGLRCYINRSCVEGEGRRVNFLNQTFRPRNVAFPASGSRKHFCLFGGVMRAWLDVFLESRFRVDLDVTPRQANLCKQDICKEMGKLYQSDVSQFQSIGT